METAHFDYDLPATAIAQVPVEPRHDARLLVDAGEGKPPHHRRVRDLPELLGPGDVVVVNTTRVLPARLHLHKDTGGAVEVFLLEPLDRPESDPAAHRWEALVRPSRKVRPGTTLVAGDDLTVTVEEHLDDGRRAVTLHTEDLVGALARHGEVPLPPYITAELADPERYQTVFAAEPGSVAAPTAGLHLTDEVLAAIAATGAVVVGVDLWVGLGTFRPITADAVEDHHIHTERYDVPAATWQACQDADRVVAVGTTSVRALESVARTGALTGRTDLYLLPDGGEPGSGFAVVDVLLTNFHLPRSSLLVLVEAFVGPRWRDLYETARAEGYRFLSFGDAMVLHRGAGHDPLSRSDEPDQMSPVR